MAFGSTAGALLEPVVGWRGLFLRVSSLAIVVLAALACRRALLGWERPTTTAPPARVVAAGYVALLRRARARRTYAYVLFNAILHSGIYTWLGVYFVQRHHLSEAEVGVALLGYGVPDSCSGPPSAALPTGAAAPGSSRWASP